MNSMHLSYYFVIQPPILENKASSSYIYLTRRLLVVFETLRWPRHKVLISLLENLQDTYFDDVISRTVLNETGTVLRFYFSLGFYEKSLISLPYRNQYDPQRILQHKIERASA